MDRLVLVGRVAGGFGVRGEVRITAYTEEPMSVARFGELKREDGSPALTIASARPVKDGVIARCPEVSSKEGADALRGLRLYAPRAAFPAPEDEDEFYLADLIGLNAQTTDGQPFGRVKAVQNFGAGDILELEFGDGRPSLYLPFTREAVPEIRLGDGLIVVSPPEMDDEEPSDGGAEAAEGLE